MAIYHYDARTLTRGNGDSSLAHYDYMIAHGESQASKDRVMWVGHSNMPSWAADNPREYWSAADTCERANGRLCKSLTIALPAEMNKDYLISLAMTYTQKVATLPDGQKLPHCVAIHVDPDWINPHMHIIISERINDGIDRQPSQHFGRYNRSSPAKGGAQKTDALKPKEWLVGQRETWANICNRYLDHIHEQRIDHRSLKARGIKREPNPHLGPRLAKEIKLFEGELAKLDQDLAVAMAVASDHAALARKAADEYDDAVAEVDRIDGLSTAPAWVRAWEASFARLARRDDPVAYHDAVGDYYNDIATRVADEDHAPAEIAQARELYAQVVEMASRMWPDWIPGQAGQAEEDTPPARGGEEPLAAPSAPAASPATTRPRDDRDDDDGHGGGMRM